MSVNTNINQLKHNLKVNLEKTLPDSVYMRRIALRIGMILSQEAQMAYPKSYPLNPTPTGSKLPLQRRSGLLANSMQPRYATTGKSTIIYFAPWGVRYAAIHEFGGFAGRGGRIRIPQRPYLSPALKAATPRIMKALTEGR